MILLTLGTAVVAQAPTHWVSVQQLAAGSEIRVHMTDGRKIVGAFQGATDDDWLVRTPKSSETLTQMMIASVSTKGRSHRLRNALIGFGGGAGVGLIAGTASDSGCPKPWEGSAYAVGSPHRGYGGRAAADGRVAGRVSRKMNSLLSCYSTRKQVIWDGSWLLAYRGPQLTRRSWLTMVSGESVNIAIAGVQPFSEAIKVYMPAGKSGAT